jgi:hypothetical protein
MKSFSENFLLKMQINVKATDMDVYFIPIFKDIYIHDVTIDTNEISSDINVIRRGGRIAQAIAHARGLDSDSIDEIAVRNTEAIANEDAFEFKTVFHNLTPVPDFNSIIIRDSQANAISDELNTRTLFYAGTSFAVKLHDACDISIDGTNFISNEDITTDTSWQDLSTERIQWAWWLTKIRNRHQISGLPFVLAKATLIAFGNANQAHIECELPATVISTKHIGSSQTLDLSTVSSYITQFTDKSITTSVETDWVNNKSTCLFFMRGDIYA